MKTTENSSRPSSDLPTFRDRRRHPRFKTRLSSELRVSRWGGTKTHLVAVTSISTQGLTLVTKLFKPAIGSKATIYLADQIEGVLLRCQWAKASSQGQNESGWAVDLKDQKRFEAEVRSDAEATVQSDRRATERRSERSGDQAGNEKRQVPRRLGDNSNVSPISFDPADLTYRREPDYEKLADEKRRKMPLPPDVVGQALGRTMLKTVYAFRDLFILLLPRSVVMKILGSNDFAFITHPRDTADVLRQFPLAKYLPDKIFNLWLRYQWPVIGERISGVRDLNGKPLNGWIIFCPLTARQMIRNRDLGRTRVLQTVKLASKMGIKIIGLGAFTSIVTRDGLDVVGKYPLHVTTGNALSAAGAIQNVAAAAHLTQLNISDATVAIVGAAGNVGSACARIFSESAKKLILIDINQRQLKTVVNELEGRIPIEVSATPDPVIKADVVIAVTNAPGAIVKPEHLKPGALVVDAAQPKNVSDKAPSVRDDILVMESSVFRYPGIDYPFDLGIGRGEALGCMAETIVLAGVGAKTNYSIGQLSAQQVKDIFSAAKMLGIRIGYFRTSEGLVDEARIKRVTNARKQSRATTPS